MIIKNTKLYDILKWLGRCVIPGLGALYFALSEIWNLPCGSEITATASAITVFLNLILGISNTNYEKDAEGND